MIYKDSCRICGGDLEEVLPLRPVPATSVNSVKNIPHLVSVDVYLCARCTLTQLAGVVDPGIYADYTYKTAISRLSEHFADQARKVCMFYLQDKSDLVVDIGANDGTALAQYKKMNCRTLGVDPSGGDIKAFFTPKVAQQIASEHGPAKIIICNNTLANVDNLHEFMRGATTLLAKNGVFIVETQYGPDVFKKGLLDVIYPEHLSYFSLRAFEALLESHGMELVNAEKIPEKGGSIRFWARHKSSSIKSGADEIRFSEGGIDLASHPMYSGMRDRVQKMNRKAQKAIENHRIIAGYGASVGCISLMHQLELEHALDFFLDEHPLKETIRGPDYSIPVYRKKDADMTMILAWRYADKITPKINGNYHICGP